MQLSPQPVNSTPNDLDFARCPILIFVATNLEPKIIEPYHTQERNAENYLRELILAEEVVRAQARLRCETMGKRRQPAPKESLGFV